MMTDDEKVLLIVCFLPILPLLLVRIVMEILYILNGYGVIS